MSHIVGLAADAFGYRCDFFAIAWSSWEAGFDDANSQPCNVFSYHYFTAFRKLITLRQSLGAVAHCCIKNLYVYARSFNSIHKFLLKFFVIKNRLLVEACWISGLC